MKLYSWVPSLRETWYYEPKLHLLYRAQTHSQYDLRGFKTNGSLFVVEFENMLIVLKGGGVFVKFLVMPLHCKILRKYVI